MLSQKRDRLENYSRVQEQAVVQALDAAGQRCV